jgi:hypothetical protein
MRHSNHRRRSAAAIGLLAGVAFLVPAAQARPVAGPPGTPPGLLVAQERLPTGALKRVFAEGITFVGADDAQVFPERDEAGNITGVSVLVPGPSSPEGIAERARNYKAHGRSPVADARAAGIPDPEQYAEPQAPSQARARRSYDFKTANVIWDSGCSTVDTGDYYWHSCFIRKGTDSTSTTAYYLADSSQAAGWSKDAPWYDAGNWLDDGYTALDYPADRTVVSWRPAQDIDVGSCYTTSFSMSGWGATLGRSWTTCPDRIHVTPYDTYFRSRWEGCTSSNHTRGSAAGVFVKVPRGYASTLWHRLGASVMHNRFCW